MTVFFQSLLSLSNLTAIISFAFSFALLIVAFVFDSKTSKIPNYLTFPAGIVGFVFSLIFTPEELPVKFVFFLILLIVGIFLPVMGAGDIKLLIALLFLSGVAETFVCLLFAAMGMILVFLMRNPKETIKDIKNAIVSITTFHIERISGQKAPFAGYLAFGFCLEFAIAFCLRGHI